MKYGKLRIAWSVMWGVMAVLVGALWVRSYWKWDKLYCTTSTTRIFALNSIDGNTVAGMGVDDTASLSTGVGLETRLPSQLQSDPAERGFALVWQPNLTMIGAPHWFLILAFASVGALPWLPFKRFSLRTLLIVTTLVAVVLGLAVWSLR